MKKYACFIACCALFMELLHPATALAQPSPLFQLPTVYPELPIFNPAFTGNVDKCRVYYMSATNKIKIGTGHFNNASALLGADFKSPIRNSRILITYGASAYLDRVALTLGDGAASTNQDEVLNYRRTDLELTFGGRLPLGLIHKRVIKRHKPHPLYNNAHHNLSLEQAIFLQPLQNTLICSSNSIRDYIAVNFALESHHAGIRQTQSLVFNDQIITHGMGGGLTPFSIDTEISDPVAPGGRGLDNAQSFDLGAGILVHLGLSNFSLLRLSAAVKHATGGFFSVPNSGQQIRPLKVFQARYESWYASRKAINLNLSYLDQNGEHIMEIGGPISQWRLDFGHPFLNPAEKRKLRGGVRVSSVIPAVSLYYFNRTIPSASALLGVRIRTNKNSDYKGNLWYVFTNYDIHFSRDLPYRVTKGNLRLGAVLEGWN